MAGSTIEEPPYQTPMVGPGGKISRWWANWFQLVLLVRAQSQPPIEASVSLTGQTASIGTTALIASANAGLYRVSWRIRVTTVGSVSSSILVTITAVDGGVTTTQASAAYTGNVTTAPQSGVFIVRADGGTAISYATTYASNAGGEMAYRLDIEVEEL